MIQPIRAVTLVTMYREQFTVLLNVLTKENYYVSFLAPLQLFSHENAGERPENEAKNLKQLSSLSHVDNQLQVVTPYTKGSMVLIWE